MMAWSGIQAAQVLLEKWAKRRLNSDVLGTVRSQVFNIGAPKPGLASRNPRFTGPATGARPDRTRSHYRPPRQGPIVLARA